MLKKILTKINGSLTARIFLITALILAVSCGATYAFLAWATPISYVSVVSDELDERAIKLAEELKQSTQEDCGPILDRFTSQTGAGVTITPKDGSPADLPGTLKNAEGEAGRDADAVDMVVISTDSTSVTSKNNSEEPQVDVAASVISVRSASASSLPFSFRDDDTVYILQVRSAIETVNQATEAMGRVLPYLLLVILAISLLGAVIYSWYITVPIVRISRISRKMADLDFTWICTEARADEIGQLGRNLNSLSERLSEALTKLQDSNTALQHDIDRERELEQQRTAFFSAASHELKTPITILKGQLSGMLAGIDVYRDRDKYLAKSLAAANRMEGLVQEILTVSRMERAGFILKQVPADLSAMVTGLSEFLCDLTDQRKQTLTTDIEPDQVIQGDPDLLERAVFNLLSNASLHSPDGAQIQVRLAHGQSGPVLTVLNSGASIPEETLPRLFDAFYRVDASRSRATGGSGLGLYLVKIILDRHQASCRIENKSGCVQVTAAFQE